MPFVRFSRDRRGYENFFLVHLMPGRRGKLRPRILYWYRTPPNIKIGRDPFDQEVMRALEAQNPGIVFDWEKLRRTPIPPPEPDWRERRRVERAAHQTREEENRDLESPPCDVAAAEAQEPTATATDFEVEEATLPVTEPSQNELSAGGLEGETTSSEVTPAVPGDQRRRRRRRRRRRGGRDHDLLKPAEAAGVIPAQAEGLSESSQSAKGSSAFPAERRTESSETMDLDKGPITGRSE